MPKTENDIREAIFAVILDIAADSQPGEDGQLTPETLDQMRAALDVTKDPEAMRDLMTSDQPIQKGFFKR